MVYILQFTLSNQTETGYRLVETEKADLELLPYFEDRKPSTSDGYLLPKNEAIFSRPRPEAFILTVAK
jgi:hypothetical protein